MQIDFDDLIKLQDWRGPPLDSQLEPTTFGREILEFIAQHFDLRPLTQHARQAIVDQGSDSAAERIFKIGAGPTAPDNAEADAAIAQRIADGSDSE